MTDELTYIVVTEQGNWGNWGKAEFSLMEACTNARLEVETPLNCFAECLEDEFDLGVATRYWNKEGKEYLREVSQEQIAITIYKWDPKYWDNFNISHMDGSVTFIPNEETREKYTDEELQKLMNDNLIRAYWRNGEILPREEHV